MSTHEQHVNAAMQSLDALPTGIEQVDATGDPAVLADVIHVATQSLEILRRHHAGSLMHVADVTVNGNGHAH